MTLSTPGMSRKSETVCFNNPLNPSFIRTPTIINNKKVASKCSREIHKDIAILVDILVFCRYVAGYAGGLVSRSHTVFCGWVSTRCRVGQLDAQEVNFGTSQLGSERLRLGAYRSSQLQTSSRGQFPTYWEPL